MSETQTVHKQHDYYTEAAAGVLYIMIGPIRAVLRVSVNITMTAG